MLENVAEEQLADSYATLTWELVYAPEPLQAEIRRQLDAVNNSEKREGEIVAPEYDKGYDIELKLRSIGERRLNVAEVPLVIQVTAEDDAATSDITLTDGNVELDVPGTNQPVQLSSAGVTIAITVRDRDSPPKPPEVQVNGQPFTFDDQIPNGQTAKFVAKIPTPRGVTVITIADKTYQVLWEPRDPIAAELPDYGWRSLGSDRWISQQIGFVRDEFKLASAQGAPMSTVRLGELLDRINSSKVGLTARIVTLAELKTEMGSPSQSEVVAGLIRKTEFDGVFATDVAKFGPYRNLLDKMKIDLGQLRQGVTAPLACKLTFCSASAGSTDVVGLPLTASLTALPKIQAALDKLITNGAWDPKPWPSDEYKSAYAVIVVEKQPPTP